MSKFNLINQVKHWDFVIPTIDDQGTNCKRVQELETPVSVHDDKQHCCTFISSGSNTIMSSEHENDEHSIVSQKKDRVLYASGKILGNFYLNSAAHYGDIIHLNADYMVNATECRTITFTIPYSTYTDAKISGEFNRAGIVCFNPKIKTSMLNSCLQQLIQSKMTENGVLPSVCGFSKYKEQWVFVATEFYQTNNLPVLITKHFNTAIDKSFDEIGHRFEMTAKSLSNPEILCAFTLIRTAAMLTTVLARADIHIPKVIFVKGDYHELAKYFHIYDREYSTQDIKDINVSEKKFSEYLKGIRDDVLLLADDESDSAYKKKQGAERIRDIRKMMLKNQGQSEPEYPFIPIIFSERLAQELDEDYVLILDASSMKRKMLFSERKTVNCLYDFDRKLINRICSEMSDFIDKMKNLYPHMLQQTEKFDLHSENQRITLAILWSIWWLITHNFYSCLEKYFSWNNICGYLINLVKKSESYCSSGDRSKEFEIVLNQMIAENEAELILNSHLSKGTNSSSEKVPIFVDDTYLYFLDSTFQTIAGKMQSSPTPSIVRKFLKEAGLLKFDSNTLMTKVTLFNTCYKGLQYITAVKRSVLTEENLSKLQGGNYNFIPCSDSDNTRIFVGTDEQGRKVFLSPNHPNLNNKHIQIIGDSGSGKSTAGNLIVRAKYNHGENIIFVDYSNSNSKSKMLTHGFDETFYNQHVREFDIESNMTEETIQLILLEMQTNRIIPLFRTPKI